MPNDRPLSGHPPLATLLGFLRCELSAPERRRVVAHLLRGCSTCAAALEEESNGLFSPPLSEAQSLRADTGWRYEFPVARSLARLRKGLLERNEDTARPIAVSREAAARALIETALELRFAEPQEGLAASAAAVAVAEGVEGPNRAEILGRAWAILGNARRRANDYLGSEAALSRALEAASDNAEALASIAEVAAANAITLRDFPTAIHLLETLIESNPGTDPERRARCLVRLATAYDYRGDSAAAIATHGRALAELQARNDPRLALSAIHSLIGVIADLGRAEEVERLLAIAEPLYARLATPMVLILRDWVQAKAATQRGEIAKAEGLLRRVQKNLLARELPYSAAVAALELAALLLDRGETQAVLALVTETASTFRTFGVAREALASLLLFQEALAQDQAKATLLAQLDRLAADLKARESGRA